MENLQPMSLFAETHIKDFAPKEEHVVYIRPCTRYRIIVEKSNSIEILGKLCYRSDLLMEQGINESCEDDKEFAAALLEAIGGNLSPHSRGHLINALQKINDEWEAERKANFPECGDVEWCKD